MKKLVLGSLVAAVASGCIITSNNPDNAHIGATWSFENLTNNTSGTPTAQVTGCPGGQFDTVALYTQQVDPSGTPVGRCEIFTDRSGACNIDLFTCGDMHGRSAGLIPDNWLTWIQIESHDGQQVYAKSTSAILDITAVDLTFNTKIVNNGGYFEYAWQLVGASSGAALNCGQANISGGMSLTASISSSMALVDSPPVPCDQGFGFSIGVPAATYQVSIDAVDTNNAALGTSRVLTNQTILPMNQITDLGMQTVKINGM